MGDLLRLLKLAAFLQFSSHSCLKTIIPAPSKINLQVCLMSKGNMSSPLKMPSMRVETIAELIPLSAIALMTACMSLEICSLISALPS